MTNKRRLLTQLVSCFTIRETQQRWITAVPSTCKLWGEWNQQSFPNIRDQIFTGTTAFGRSLGNTFFVFALTTDSSPPHSFKHLNYQNLCLVLERISTWTWHVQHSPGCFLQTKALELIKTPCIVLIFSRVLHYIRYTTVLSPHFPAVLL